MFEKLKTLSVVFFTCLFAGNGQAEMSAFTPEAILPNGADSTVAVNPYTGESGVARKGTVAATIQNVVLLNQLLLKPNRPETEQEIEKIASEINKLVPSLRVVGIFDFFEPLAWVGSEKQPGRVLAALLYLKQYPDEMTDEIRGILQKISASTTSDYLRTQLQTAL